MNPRSNGSPKKDTGKGFLMLQKQTPASEVPKFNPHGPQPPPQLKQPPRSPPKRYGKKAQKVEEKIDFASFDIEAMLQDEGIEFRNPEKAPGGWLPLEAYDDQDFEQQPPLFYVQRKTHEATNAKGLWKDRDGLCYWRRIKIVRVLAKSERLEGLWENTNEKARLPRIHVLFNEEDPRVFARRFKHAYETRKFADSLIKYNYYVENMPTHEIPELDHEQINRILMLTQNTKALRGKSSADTTVLLNEVNFDFGKTMNRIIFDKHMVEKGSELITGQLHLPPKPKEPEPPYYGMIGIPQHDYPGRFSQFCASTLLGKEEVIVAMNDIKKECNDVMTRDIFNPNITKTMRVEEFKQIQASSISQTSYYLRETWVGKLRDIVKNNFHDSSKAWFNLQETSREAYEVSRLKKFLIQQKFVMQDTLLFLTKKSVHNFVDSLLSFLPLKVNVIDAFKVDNFFVSEEEQKELEDDPLAASSDPISLFAIDLLLEEGAMMPQYSIEPMDVVVTIMTIFDNGLEALQEIMQLEQKLLPHLFKSNQKFFLKSTRRPREEPPKPDPNDKRLLPDENEWVWFQYMKLKEKLLEAIYPLDDYLQIYKKYETEYKLNVEEYVKSQAGDDENPPEVDALRKDIYFHLSEEKRLRGEIPDRLNVSMFNVSCREMRDALAGKHRRIAEEEILLIAKVARNKTQEVLEKFEKIHMKIESVPKDIEELTSIKEFMGTLPKEIEKEQNEIVQCMQIFDVLDEFEYKFTDDEEYDKKWRMFGAPKDTYEKIDRQIVYLEKEKEKFVTQMQGQQNEFTTNITEIETLVSSFSQYQDINQYEEVAGMVRTINARLQTCNEQAKTFNNRELLTGNPQTDYTQVQQLQKEFQPYSNLWLTTATWFKSHNSWLNDEWEKLDPGEVETTFEASVKTANQVIRFFRDKDLPAILKIAETIKEDVEKFRPWVPVALALRKEGMKERHWEQISEKVGREVKPDEHFTFQTVMDMKLKDWKDEIEDIGERAAKEYNIECNLLKMKTDWESILFTLKPFKATGTYSVLGFDDAMAMLDENIVLTQAMQFSPFKKPFEEEIEEWNATLLYVSDTIEEWIKCQGQWMYLQPIFDSPDIMKQLPLENKKFKNVDKQWREIIHGTQQNKLVIKACTREGLLERFQEMNTSLDIVQKGLKDYLEQKRSIFARFYFLSNDELLEILSQTKEVRNVRPHLRKVFENMADLEFKQDNTMVAMYSGEKECIQFVDKVDPRDKGVEFWMGDVENMMITSVRHVLLYSVQDYTAIPRPDWIRKHPGQCVLNGSQVHWTSEVEEAFKTGGNKGIADYFKKLGEQLLETVKLVREKLTKLQSTTLGALIVIDVHAKDVVEKLVTEKVEDVSAFEWISQLRYYWPQQENECFVRCIQTNFPYGYEYLGNTLRLVITPLTDKCYMTLMGALQLNLGGNPAGPAGTGKTESTKDLAKALAKQCVVFNCSDGMDYIMVGKFFKGLASAGAWCCFDEFNRINIEVLSVIAQQLLQLFGAKAAGEEEVNFEESLIKLKPTFSVFVTMNPGYAGRTELPDNLKALFRPVAMMVPDYALIGQIMLYSFGFAGAKTLAEKMVTTFKLSSEQLSSQDHYDYGMRAVRSVINAAGLLKMADPDMNEDQLLLRALRDVNVPKFLKDDLPLFENIISDLFPGVERPNIDYGEMLKQIEKSCAIFNLQAVDMFIMKIIQLYDTTQVRHGLMIVGPTGGGKTSNYRILSHALTELRHLEQYERVNVHVLNPKSITMGQMYGEMDTQTSEWIDGVLAIMVADCARDQSPEKHWIMFDGPVDALWIENMNTVLDDNKKLCLNSGQIITLTDRMTMMFEVEDLAVASPATVSRCGMVYMEPESLGLEVLIKSYFNTLPPAFKTKKTFYPNLHKLFDTYFMAMKDFMRRNCGEPVKTMDNNITQSLHRILDCYFADYWETEIKKISSEEVENLESMLEPLFLYALTWSICCTTDFGGRSKLDKQLKEMMKTANAKFKFPEQGMIYDYVFDQSEKRWKPWLETIPEYKPDIRSNYSEIVVPTHDSVRMKYLMNLLIRNKKHLLFPGNTGTGKTVNVSEQLISMPEEYQSMVITFSAQTSANQTQDALDEKFEKRRKGVYGPAPGRRFIIFVDDLNMPKKEQYGAQPPIEILRQWMDHHGWFDRKPKEKPFIRIEDIIFVSAMGPPGGGRSVITGRFMRHFNICTYTNLEDNQITLIFRIIVKAFLEKFTEKVVNTLESIVEMTLRIYTTVATELKPTPTKSHYTFNLRDISKIFQGVCSAYQKTTVEVVDICRLWIHENKRVFGDRMVSQDDRDKLDKLLDSEVESVFKLSREQVYHTERIVFGDYMKGIDMENRPYEPVDDLKLMLEKMEEYLEEYNSTSKTQMKLILFLDACDHVSRISRVLRQPQGNALLLGVGGSGRQSLARLASFLRGYKCFQIEVVKGYSMTNWKENLRDVLKMAGVEGKPQTFLFADTQIINEQMVEDINNILNSGDIPGLYKTEDFEDIYKIGKQECMRKQLQLSKMNMFACYLALVKQNIHVVLAMSPLGDIFRTRLRMFPSLVNCCTIDWFTEWPEEALLNVARGAIQETDLGLGEYQESVVEMFKVMHQSVEKKSKQYLDELRRHNYVTPTSYLELLNLYKSILTERRKYFGDARQRLQTGLNVLKEAAVEIANLRVMLDKKQPELEKTKVEVANTKKIIVQESKEAEETKKVVAADEAEASVKEAEVSKIKKSVDDDLAEALPALDKAVKKLDELKVDDFYELKAMKTPTKAVVYMFEITCLMMKLPKPKKPNDPKKLQYDPDGYFDLAQDKLLKNPKGFLESLKTYDKDNIADQLVAKVSPMLEREENSIKAVEKASKALVAVHIWCGAMVKYHEVLKIVNPKREEAKVMGAELDSVQRNLAEKRAKLKEVNDKIALLEAQFKEKQEQEKQLLLDIEECAKKLERAEKMITGLEGEKIRWTETVAKLGVQIGLLIGDCLIASGIVAYAGPFISSYRSDMEEEWRKDLVRLNLEHSPGVHMRGVLGDDVTIRMWNIAGLPNDGLSIENGIIMFKSRRWPLMIDPQTQANKFVKNLGKSLEPPLEAYKPSEGNLLRNLEFAIQFGRWILLENVGEELDPALEPILLQQKVKTGSGYTIKLGDKTITYNLDFRFYMTTTLPNPHYQPETSVKVTILNFAITPEGLEEQMLNQLVQAEQPELQEKKNQIVEENAKAAKDLRDIEDAILRGLTKNDNIADILNDDELNITLDMSKKTSDEINVRMKESEITEKAIDETRESYRPVAFRASLLFFCVVDLATVDNMYQYSLQWFQTLFAFSISGSEPANEIPQRIVNLNNYFTQSLYENVCRGLFEKHKLLFSFMLTMKILFGDNAIDMQEWRYYLAGPSGEIEILPNPTDWLDELEWAEVYKQLVGMSHLPIFKGIDTYFVQNHFEFKRIFDDPNAHEAKWPGEWDTKLNSFQKMILLKSIRADKMIPAIQNYITEKVGRQFIEPPTFNLANSFRDSSQKMPLIFVLSPGSDPVADFKRFSAEMEMERKTDSISLGQGQDKKAERMIDEGKQRGGWVLLANCHLAESWMPKLERIVEQLNDQIHSDFRMWLTSMPSAKFPVSTLQNSVKMTLEPPTGLRANLARSYASLDNRELNDCKKVTEFKKLLFGFCLFHAVVQDRRKFGPIGWNIPYAFTNEDLTVCKRQLKLFLDDYDEVPYKVLTFLGAEINYGGRVTDDKDSRLINNILQTYINAGTITDGHKFSESGIYNSPPAGTLDDYLTYIKNLPLNPHPEVFGLHENAEITTNQAETRLTLETILSVQPRTSAGAGKSREQLIGELAAYIETRTPKAFSLEEVVTKYPTSYNESMNTVLTQEVIRYNRLLVVMADMLKNVQKALVGEVVMSEDLEKMANSLFDNQVPSKWADTGFLSMKPLSSWVQDLNDRVNFLEKWIDKGPPPTYWISGFFFPQAFFTGTLQNYARKHVIAIDELSFEVKYYDDISPHDVQEKPEDGCYLYGLYLEGARWNSNTHMLDDSRPKSLYVEMPMIWFLPKQNRKIPETGIYMCPVYKVLSRTGTLSTTGHSTNYVLMLEVPTTETQNKWIKAGVAAFLALRY